MAHAAHDPGRVLKPRSDPIGEVPPGYAVHRVADAWLILDQKARPDLVPLQLADARARNALFARAPRRGRGAAPSVALADGSSLVLRRYRHGGLLGRLTGALYLGPARALSELQVTARAEQLGAPVPHVLCLVLWPMLGPLWSAVIGTREEAQATDLLTSLRDARDPAERRRLARLAGDAVGRLHDAGVEHPDLQLRNVIVTPDSRVVIIDLDGAVFHRHGRLSVNKRAANLGRLVRSAVKNGIWGRVIDRRDLAAFAAAYTRDRRPLRRALRARIPLERWKLALHRLSYPFRS